MQPIKQGQKALCDLHSQLRAVVNAKRSLFRGVENPRVNELADSIEECIGNHLGEIEALVQREYGYVIPVRYSPQMKSCGANGPGGRGFQQGNTCGKRGGQFSASSVHTKDWIKADWEDSATRYKNEVWREELIEDIKDQYGEDWVDVMNDVYSYLQHRKQTTANELHAVSDSIRQAAIESEISLPSSMIGATSDSAEALAMLEDHIESNSIGSLSLLKDGKRLAVRHRRAFDNYSAYHDTAMGSDPDVAISDLSIEVQDKIIPRAVAAIIAPKL